MLWLIGMMGSGKSAVGTHVAEKLGWDFVDTDLLIASVTESSIPDLWRQRGEGQFRRLESQMIASAAAGDPVVVATGGGAVLDPGNIAVMRDSGLVIWLAANPRVLAARTGRDSNRPLLAESPDPVGELERLLAERRPRYEEASHAVVDTDGKQVAEVANEVMDLWNAS